MGRFMTPDPAGMLAVDVSNPQSWNMYSYVLNNPLGMIDPTGTDGCSNTAGGYQYIPSFDPDTGDLEFTYAPTSMNTSCTVTAPQPDLFDTLDSDITGGLQWLQDFSSSFSQINPVNLIAPLNRCAAANATSAKNLLRVKSNSFLANAFLGNDFSSLSNLAFGPQRASAAGSLAVSNPTPANLTYQGGKAIANGVGVTTTTTTSATVSTPTYDITASITETSTQSLARTGVGQALGKLVGFLSNGKLGFDAATYLYAEGACAIR
jgi:hypothetical protein